MFKQSIALAATLLLLAGCGATSPSATSRLTRSGDAVAAQELRFRPVTIKELVSSPYDDPKSIGNLITFEASFGRDRWSYAYGTTTEGYRLWDRDGHGIRCFNIYAETSPMGRDVFRDFNPGASWLLNYGTFVTIEGAYHPGYPSSSHGGAFNVEKSVDVYFINGKPVRDFVQK